MISELERGHTRSARPSSGGQTAASVARFLGLWAVLALTLILCGRAAAADERPFGVVIAVGDIEMKPLLSAARTVGGARWRSERVVPPKSSTEDPSGKEVAALRRAYYDADFLGCLSLLQLPELRLELLMERGQRRAASQVAFLAAACAHGARDPKLTRVLLRRALLRELEPPSDLQGLRPDFLGLLEQMRKQVSSLSRVALVMRSEPPGAEVLIDGGTHQCERTPCTRNVFPGEHVVTLRHFGFAPRVIRHSAARNSEMQATLDEARPAEARKQLAQASGSTEALGGEPFYRVAATAYGAPVVAAMWRDRAGRGRCMVYDRRVQRIVANVTAQGDPKGLEQALRMALIEWQGEISPPFYKRPLFYVGVAGAVVVTAIVTYFLLRKTDTQHELYFP